MAWTYAAFCLRGRLLSIYRVGNSAVSFTMEIFSISCVAIAVENLTRHHRRKKCDASTYQSNNCGVSRKRFKPSTPGSINIAGHEFDISGSLNAICHVAISFGTKALSLTVSKVFNGECDAMVHVTLNDFYKGQGHSFWYQSGWNCRGFGVEPPVHVYRRSFLSKIGFKFQSLGKISNILAADPSPTVLLGQFQLWHQLISHTRRPISC